MELTLSKEELQIEKAFIDSKIATLSTKAGKDAFVAAEAVKLESAISVIPERTATKPGNITMKAFLRTVKGITERYPAKIVEQEIAAITAKSLAIDAALAIEKPIEAEPLETGGKI